ncbi:MAG: hypothetical protein K0B14_01245 [Anaerolineaceae bacterium]|nr:hypothetical protein [Anaerolineaceae bacterium]
MNRSSPGSSKPKVALTLVKAIDGYLKFKTAEGLSPRTITSYEFTLSPWKSLEICTSPPQIFGNLYVGFGNPGKRLPLAGWSPVTPACPMNQFIG